MIRFDCDWCRRTKAPDEIWVLGLAAESVAATAARREVSILPVWKRDTAVHPLAVHFCSEQCKDDYMDALFAERPLPAVEVVAETAVSRRAPQKKSTGVSSARAKGRSTGKRRKRAA
jgi:hypothetical protein